MRKIRGFIIDTGGDAVVEATFLFPVMLLVLAALILLSIYMPTRAVLQRATQYAATAIATEKSDTWIYFDEGEMLYKRHDSKAALSNVYVSLFQSVVDSSDRGGDSNRSKSIVRNIENDSISIKTGNLDVMFALRNYVVYKEIIVTAKRTIPVPINLSVVMFPRQIPIEVTSIAVVQNGDEFVRNMDIAVDFVEFIFDYFGLEDVTDEIKKAGDFLSNVLGW